VGCERELLETELGEGSTVAASEAMVASEVTLNPVKGNFESIMAEKNYEHLVKAVFPSSRMEEMEVLIIQFISNYEVEHGPLPRTYIPAII